MKEKKKSPTFLCILAEILGRSGVIGIIVFNILDAPWFTVISCAILIAGLGAKIESELS